MERARCTSTGDLPIGQATSVFWKVTEEAARHSPSPPLAFNRAVRASSWLRVVMYRISDIETVVLSLPSQGS